VLITTASLITIFRILLIPVYVTVAIYYAHTVKEHEPDQRLRIAAIVIFTIASLSDALDGWVARRFNQRSRLGAILDPLADKLLLLAVLGVLCFSDWPVKLPLWFVVIAVSREVLSIAGAFLVDHVAGSVKIEPHFTGKLSTPFQLLTLGCAMLEVSNSVLIPIAAVASFFAFTSGMIYIYEAFRQIQAAGHDDQEPPKEK
jgi:CDP-diacylglycerol--glycerol-3-phosphate 3-phosphatidyltransferase/cardiolipin synthase